MPISNRFAVSLLSKSNRQEALLEEVMIDKATGQIAIYMGDEKLLSYDASAREYTTFEKIKTMGTEFGFKNIFVTKLISDKFDFPVVIPLDENILQNSIPTANRVISQFFLVPDIDILVPTLDTPVDDRTLKCQIVYSYKPSDTDVILYKTLEGTVEFVEKRRVKLEATNSLFKIERLLFSAPTSKNFKVVLNGFYAVFELVEGGDYSWIGLS